MRLRLLALVLFALVAIDPRAAVSQAPPAPDASRIAAAKAMMEAAGVAAQFDQVMPLLMEQLSRSFVNLRPDKASEIREVLGTLVKRFLDRKGVLIDAVAVLYANALSEEDLKAVADFYNSPAGVRFKSVQPNVMRQAMIAGQRWGEQLGREMDREAREELKKRGIEL